MAARESKPATRGSLELDISPTCVKLKIKNTNKQAQSELGRAANVEQVRAKMAKKEAKLKVTLPYVLSTICVIS